MIIDPAKEARKEKKLEMVVFVPQVFEMVLVAHAEDAP